MPLGKSLRFPHLSRSPLSPQRSLPQEGQGGNNPLSADSATRATGPGVLWKGATRVYPDAGGSCDPGAGTLAGNPRSLRPAPATGCYGCLFMAQKLRETGTSAIVSFLYQLTRFVASCRMRRVARGLRRATAEAQPPRRLGGAGRHRGRPLPCRNRPVVPSQIVGDFSACSRISAVPFSPGPHRRAGGYPSDVRARGSRRSPASAALRHRLPHRGDRP